jgi:hypothetical protein
MMIRHSGCVPVAKAVSSWRNITYTLGMIYHTRVIQVYGTVRY